MNKINKLLLYIAIIGIAGTITFNYIFDKKLDINGDNYVYYMLAKSVAQGKGYKYLASRTEPYTNTYPPGYPLLMSPIIKILPDSVEFNALKIENGVFLIASLMVLFLLLIKLKLHPNLALVLTLLALFNSHLLHFSKMMMSEISLVLVSSLALLLLYRVQQIKDIWRTYHVYLFAFLLTYTFLIRTQGITLFAGVVFYFLFRKQWKHLLTTVVLFILFNLPWIIRNEIRDVGSNKYLAFMMRSDPFDPYSAKITFGGFIERIWDNMLFNFFKAIPDALFPFLNIDYKNHLWFAGILIIVFISWGLWKLPQKFGIVILGYFLATLGLLALWNYNFTSRYITTIIPLIAIIFFYGAYHLLEKILLNLNLNISLAKSKKILPFLLLLMFFAYQPTLKKLNKSAKSPHHPAYSNYYKIAKEIKKKLPETTLVACRKPNMFYLYAGCYTKRYLFTKDDARLIKNLITSKTDYVVLEQLGYSSTPKFLLPAIRKNLDLFTPVMHLKRPDTYLFKFNIKKAKKKFNM